MKMKLPGMADSALNMTPMIDIVFQLILFFLLSLKFKSLDYRFEAMLPKDRGPSRDFAIPPEIHSLDVSLFRLDEADPARARTKVKFAGAEWIVPAGATPDERDAIFASLGAKLRAVKAVAGADRGEIKTPRPTGGSVPHGDVMKVLDTFFDAQIHDVLFEGAASPLPRRN
jgi:hypothetical protein